MTDILSSPILMDAPDAAKMVQEPLNSRVDLVRFKRQNAFGAPLALAVSVDLRE